MSDSIFLSAEELKTLTGAMRKTKQIKVLEQNNIPYSLNRKGEPVVTRISVTNNGNDGSSAIMEA